MSPHNGRLSISRSAAPLGSDARRHARQTIGRRSPLGSVREIAGIPAPGPRTPGARMDAPRRRDGTDSGCAASVLPHGSGTLVHRLTPLSTVTVDDRRAFPRGQAEGPRHSRPPTQSPHRRVPDRGAVHAHPEVLEAVASGRANADGRTARLACSDRPRATGGSDGRGDRRDPPVGDEGSWRRPWGRGDASVSGGRARSRTLNDSAVVPAMTLRLLSMARERCAIGGPWTTEGAGSAGALQVR